MAWDSPAAPQQQYLSKAPSLLCPPPIDSSVVLFIIPNQPKSLLPSNHPPAPGRVLISFRLLFLTWIKLSAGHWPRICCLLRDYITPELGQMPEWRDSDGDRSLRFGRQAQVLPNRDAAGYLGHGTGGGVLVGVGPRQTVISLG